MYIITVLEICLTSQPSVQTPTSTYFYLSNLPLVAICFFTTTIPKVLVNIQRQRQVTTYESYISQMYLYIYFAVGDIFLLTLMVYNHLLVICHSLR